MILLFILAVISAAERRASGGTSSLPYRSTGECNNSTSEYFVRELSICCSRCRPGTRLRTQCTSDVDSVCGPCPDGQYQENMNHYGNCFSCYKCKEHKGLTYGRSCSADSRPVCVCRHGMFCSRVNTNAGCEMCSKYRSCSVGEGVVKHGTPTTDVKCEPCPSGTFSNQINTEPCKPHTQCEGLVLSPGSSTADTVCEKTTSTPTKVPTQIPINPKIPPSGLQGTTAASDQTVTVTLNTTGFFLYKPSTISSPGPETMTIFYCVGAAVLLSLLILAVTVKTCKVLNRKGLAKVAITEDKKQEQIPIANCTPESQCLLLVDGCHKDPSMCSTDSQSQPDSNNSVPESETESVPEQPSVSSPLVNLSITATFNCQLNPATGSCSIPFNPPPLTPQTEAPVPLSQEEVCISCQQEDGKEALQSVQESDPRVF